MRRVFLFFLLFIPLPAAAQDARGCPTFEDPDIAIELVQTPPRLNTDRVQSTLAQMSGDDPTNLSSGQHEVPIGLTVAALSLKSSYNVRTSARRGDPMVCAQIAAFTLRFGFEDTTIYIAHEIPKATCGYNEILAHERRHVETDRLFLEAYKQLLPNLLGDAIRKIGVIRASSSPMAEQRLHEIIAPYLRDLGASLAQARAKRQAEIDTPEEYRRLTESCAGALAKIAPPTR